MIIIILTTGIPMKFNSSNAITNHFEISSWIEADYFHIYQKESFFIIISSFFKKNLTFFKTIETFLIKTFQYQLILHFFQFQMT